MASLEATYYHQTATDLIDYVTVEVNPFTLQFQNVGRVRNRGLELAGTASLGPSLSVRATYTWMTSRVRALAAGYTGDLRPGDALLGIPNHSGGATLTHSGRHGTVSLSATYVGTRTQTDYRALYGYYYGGQPYRGSPQAYWTPFPGFVKFGLRASRDVTSHLSALLSVDNLTNNDRIEEYDTTPTTGRLVLIGLRVR